MEEPITHSSSTRGSSTDIKSKLAEDAKRGAKAAASRAESMASMGLDQAGKQLRGVGHALGATHEKLREEDHALAEPVGRLGARVERFAEDLTDREPREIVRDVENYARRNPWLFLGGCVLGGMALARFLKASEPDTVPALPPHRPERTGPGVEVLPQRMKTTSVVSR